MPRVKPPRTVEKGLWASQLLNNVETYANVPRLSYRVLTGSTPLEQRKPGNQDLLPDRSN